MQKKLYSYGEICKEQTHSLLFWQGGSMKKTIVSLFAMAFLFSFGSCDDAGRKCVDPEKCPDRPQKERHERRW